MGEPTDNPDASPPTPGDRRRLLERLLRERAAPEETVPLSVSQERIWVAQLLDAGDAGLNMRTAIRFPGGVDREALVTSLEAVIERHPQLRARFVERDGRPTAVIAAQARAEVRHVDLDDRGTEDRESLIRSACVAEAGRPFQLERGPLVRLSTLGLEAGEVVAVLAVHHIVCDAWSMEILVRETLEVYQAAIGGTSATLPPVGSYADFARAQREALSDAAARRLEAYWSRALADFRGEPPLAADHPRTAAHAWPSRRRRLDLWPESRSDVERAAAAVGVTSNLVLLAALAATLFRAGGVRDLVVATPVADRAKEEWESVVGYFVSLLPLRLRAGETMRFDALVAETRRALLEAHEHRALPLHRIAEVGGVPPGRLLRVLFQHSVASATLESGGAGFLRESIDLGGTRHEISLTTHVEGDRLAGILEYSVGLFEPATAERLAAEFGAVLRQAVADPGVRLDDLEVSADWPQRAAEPSPVASRDLVGAAVEGGDGALGRLASIWREALDLDELSPYESFLDAGGDSLTAMQVLERVEAELGVRLAAGDLFTQTLAQLAADCDRRRG